MGRVNLSLPVEFVLEVDSSVEVVAGPYDPKDEAGFEKAMIEILREEPWEEREFVLLTIDSDGSAFTQEFDEDYLGELELEAWEGLAKPDEAEDSDVPDQWAD